MAGVHKLQRLDGTNWVKHEHLHVWRREPTTGPERIVAGPRSGHVALLQALSTHMSEPLVVLYVLLVSHSGRESGRYESPALNREECADFLQEHRGFLENDGRHHLWLLAENGTIILDNHQLIYAYGDLSAFESELHKAGLLQGVPKIPAPHSHCYNVEFDDAEDAVMNRWEWRHFPLQDSDDR